MACCGDGEGGECSVKRKRLNGGAGGTGGGQCEGQNQSQSQNQSQDQGQDDIWLADGDEMHFTPANVDKDDIFGDTGTAVSGHVDTLAMRRAHVKQGFVKGLAAAKARATQTGFDDGYASGSALGLKIGAIVAKLNVMKLSHDGGVAAEAAAALAQAKTELYVANVLNHKYFDKNIDLPAGQHELVLKWESVVDEMWGRG